MIKNIYITFPQYQIQIYTVLCNKIYNMGQKEQGRGVCCYSIDPLNLSDFKMNLIADSNKIQFCWKLNFLLPERSSSNISWSV